MDREELREMEEKRWRFEKTIGVGHILTTLLIAASVFAWGQRMDARLIVVETRQVHNRELVVRAEQDLTAAVKDLKAYLVRIEDKLDDKADK